MLMLMPMMLLLYSHVVIGSSFVTVVDLGGSSGMAMRRTIASKGDSIINSLHALMDQLHRKVPGFHDSSFACSSLTWGSPDKEGEGGSSAAADSSHMPSALDVVFRAENEASGPGGLSHDQTNELRALSLQTSDRLKNLYCNAVGLLQHDEHSQSTQLKRTLSPPVMRKTSVAHRDDEFMNDVDYMESVITASDGVLRPTAATPPLSQQPSQWTTFHDQDGISVSEFCHSDYPMDTLMASCHVEVCTAPTDTPRTLILLLTTPFAVILGEPSRSATPVDRKPRACGRAAGAKRCAVSLGRQNFCAVDCIRRHVAHRGPRLSCVNL